MPTPQGYRDMYLVRVDGLGCDSAHILLYEEARAKVVFYGSGPRRDDERSEIPFITVEAADDDDRDKEEEESLLFVHLPQADIPASWDVTLAYDGGIGFTVKASGYYIRLNDESMGEHGQKMVTAPFTLQCGSEYGVRIHVSKHI